MFTARNYVLFKEIIGDKPDEAQLQELLPNIAYLCAAVASLNFPRQKNILSPKMEERILQLLPADISKLQNRELLLADDVVEKIKTLFATKLHKYLVPGTVHGDINLKNILLVKMARLQDQGMALVDSEFGTDYAKPAFDKPRFQDGAYFYHLLYCQYHRPDLAEQFMRLYSNALKDAGVEMETSFQFEFYASVLERTVSMSNHFV